MQNKRLTNMTELAAPSIRDKVLYTGDECNKGRENERIQIAEEAKPPLLGGKPRRVSNSCAGERTRRVGWLRSSKERSAQPAE